MKTAAALAGVACGALGHLATSLHAGACDASDATCRARAFDVEAADGDSEALKTSLLQISSKARRSHAAQKANSSIFAHETGASNNSETGRGNGSASAAGPAGNGSDGFVAIQRHDANASAVADGSNTSSALQQARSSQPLPCPSETGGFCTPLKGCDPSRGPTQCSWGLCKCQPNYCAVLGKCISNVEAQVMNALDDKCNVDTGGTCWLMGCDESRGHSWNGAPAVQCQNHKCVCVDGYCVQNGKCVLSPLKNFFR
eukprot:TRINITY_DN37692_c0_g1_i2.p1 TRINITY_DN37692_c0_g1~~TRINITY_DN37692_c0_g1_i2.p1  ORF type:complete len:257 (+),score=46.40 TRINITY_DN37692_c0_g1_i2:123-893(+)